MLDIKSITNKLIKTSKIIELNIVRQNIEMQIAEAGLLQSMYPEDHEFKLNNMTMIEDLQNWLKDSDENNENPDTSYHLCLHLMSLKCMFGFHMNILQTSALKCLSDLIS